MTPAAGRIRPLLRRLGLSRTEGRSGDPGGKSLLNPVEMKSDSLRGHSEGIRTTCLWAEHFSERKASHERCVCPFTGQDTSHALFLCDCSFAPQAGKSKGCTPYPFYHQAAYSVRERLHPTL